MKSELKKLQDIMKLNDWDISLHEEEALECDARTKMIYDDYKAIIVLKAELNHEEKVKSLIHELVHLIYRDCLDTACDFIENNAVVGIYTRQHERSIEKTAKIIYKILYR